MHCYASSVRPCNHHHKRMAPQPAAAAPPVLCATKPKRSICQRCERPDRTCLCAVLPAQPVALSGHVIVIRHPNEKKKPMATIPVLAKCLRDLTVLDGRQYKACASLHGPSAACDHASPLVQAEQSPVVDELLALAASGACPLYLLFPGPSEFAPKAGTQRLSFQAWHPEGVPSKAGTQGLHSSHEV